MFRVYMILCTIVLISASIVAGLLYAEYLNGQCTGDEYPPLAFGVACMATITGAAGLIVGFIIWFIRKNASDILPFIKKHR